MTEKPDRDRGIIVDNEYVVLGWTERSERQTEWV